MRSQTGWRVAFALAAAYVGLLGVFWIPARPLPHVSAGIALTLPANYALCRWGRRLGGGSVGAALPAITWLVVVLFFGLGRPEGDRALLANGEGFGLMMLGAFAAAAGISARPRSSGLSHRR